MVVGMPPPASARAKCASLLAQVSYDQSSKTCGVHVNTGSCE